jgi:hypothetical protein
MKTAHGRRHFRVDQRQGVVGPLVQEKRRVVIHGKLEPALRLVVGDGSAWFHQYFPLHSLGCLSVPQYPENPGGVITLITS